MRTYDEFPPPAARPRGARRTSEETWARARDEYLAGESAPTVCARFDIGLSSFRERARLDGWRRTDMKDSTLTGGRTALAAGASYLDLAAEAGMRLRDALARGRAADVVSWMRVQDQLAARKGVDLAAFADDIRRDATPAAGCLPGVHRALARLADDARGRGDPDADPELRSARMALDRELAGLAAAIEDLNTLVDTPEGAAGIAPRTPDDPDDPDGAESSTSSGSPVSP